MPESPGPSPRAWGLQDDLGNRPLGIRTIPTRVGITHRASLFCVGTSDHPHARGDYVCITAAPGAVHGPSPRAWGLRALTAQQVCVLTDHPHARGDYNNSLRNLISGSGPSPRAWGLQEHRHFRSNLLPDHPHARGDYTLGTFTSFPMCGPSPRAWGLRLSLGRESNRRRTIPTRVGITFLAGPTCVVFPDHPHARGDYVFHVCFTSRQYGPSPRAWGLPTGFAKERRIKRTIPTRVGITTVLSMI